MTKKKEQIYSWQFLRFCLEWRTTKRLFQYRMEVDKWWKNEHSWTTNVDARTIPPAPCQRDADVGRTVRQDCRQQFKGHSRMFLQKPIFV